MGYVINSECLFNYFATFYMNSNLLLDSHNFVQHRFPVTLWIFHTCVACIFVLTIETTHAWFKFYLLTSIRAHYFSCITRSFRQWTTSTFLNKNLLAQIFDTFCIYFWIFWLYNTKASVSMLGITEYINHINSNVFLVLPENVCEPMGPRGTEVIQLVSDLWAFVALNVLKPACQSSC